jgi:hypothetical protein
MLPKPSKWRANPSASGSLRAPVRGIGSRVTARIARRVEFFDRLPEKLFEIAARFIADGNDDIARRRRIEFGRFRSASGDVFAAVCGAVIRRAVRAARRFVFGAGAGLRNVFF